MNRIVAFCVRLIRAAQVVYARKWSFLGLFAVAFFGSVSVLAALDLLPDMAPVAAVPAVTVADNQATTSVVVTELPAKIEIPAINLAVAINNPTTIKASLLDAELLKGAVRYPTSAKLGEEGNVVLFGHSSYLPIVGNQAYKSFNGIQKLTAGDTVMVYSSTTAYTYRVRSVAKENTVTGAIPLSVPGKVLTLATCNSFGTKEDRFVVVADFVGSNPISI